MVLSTLIYWLIVLVVVIIIIVVLFKLLGYLLVLGGVGITEHSITQAITPLQLLLSR